MEFNVFDFNKKSINKNKVLGVIGIILLIVLICICIYYYNFNLNFRNFMDIYIFRKEISSENLPEISIDKDTNPFIYTYSNYTIVISKNKLSAYNKDKLDFELDIYINNPCVYSSGNYLIIGEKNGNKLYVIKDKNIVWENDLEGTIDNVYINENGYSAITLSQSSYKSVIKVFNNYGSSLFTSYFAEIYSTKLAISPDNKLLAIAQLDISGIKSSPIIKVISIDKAINQEPDSTIYTYISQDSTLITNINYINKDTLLCMYDNKICSLKDGTSNILYEINDNITLYATVALNNNYLIAEKNQSNLLNPSTIFKIFNVTSGKQVSYELFGTAKNIFTYENIIAINLGTEVHIINTSGWLVKKYTASSEIKNIHLFKGRSNN